MDPQVTAAIIGTIGTVAAAGITAIVAIKIERKIFPKKIETFGDKDHNVMKIIDRAQSSVYIIAQIGDSFWDLHQDKIEGIMKAKGNLEIRCLVLCKEKFKELQRYTREYTLDEEGKNKVKEKVKTKGIDKDKAMAEAMAEAEAKYEETMEKLKVLSSDPKKKFLLKEFHQIMTASYIAVDIDGEDVKGKWAPSSAIQIMTYQYNLPTRNSLLYTINPETVGKDKFALTVNSIKDMWDDGYPLQEDNY